MSGQRAGAERRRAGSQGGRAGTVAHGGSGSGASGRAGIEVELIGCDGLADVPSRTEIESLCAAAVASAGIAEGHLAIELVGPQRIAQLNAAHRGKAGPTDVLSFPIDGTDPLGGAGVERELGDIVICPQETSDVGEAIVHGVLHLLGMDHETDSGEMLALQAEILAAAKAGRRSG